jgi:hypothetical protein
MKTMMRSGVLWAMVAWPLALLAPPAAMAQSGFNGTWKVDLSTYPVPKTTFVWLLQDGMYQCKSCDPPIDVKANGEDQQASRSQFDTISVTVVDEHTVREIEKKNGLEVSDEKFTVSRDGKTVKDEFANWITTDVRIAKGPAGSHAISGSWRPLKMESSSDKELLLTYKLEGNTLSMSRPTGQSYAAKLDGTEAPYTGDPNISSLSLKRISRNTIEESQKLRGEVVRTYRMTVGPDGKTMSIAMTDTHAGTTTHFIAKKQ